MSFLEQEEILQLIENLYIRLIETLFPEKKINQKPFSRLTYEEAIKKYNSDRPDLRQDKNNSNELAFIWIFDFPMFEKKEDGTIGAAHHPFTRPKGEIALDVLAYQYDLVCNGFEIGGGSLRTHDREVLKKVFDFLGHSEENFMERFGHLWEAFAFGVPPHGGIAMGLDRFLAILLGEPNIREVIAFPKTGDGRDLMMGAPSVVDKNQLRDLGLK